MTDGSTTRLGVSIRLFLADGTPDGLRLVEKSNWTGRALVCSRTQYPEVRVRPEFNRPSVYVLSGPSEDDDSSRRVYIGEADQARSRLDSHLRNKDFWTHLTLFTSKDENLNKAHVRYIESRLVELATKAKRAELDNGNAPAIPQLSEPEIADAEAFLADMLLICPVLGLDDFEVAQEKSKEGTQLYLTARGANAEGRDTAEGFLVLAGSSGRVDTTPSIHKYLIDLRQSLLAKGILAINGEAIRLTQDYLFDSPSTAASIMMGRSANGRAEWKDETGRPLRAIQEAALVPVPGEEPE